MIELLLNIVFGILIVCLIIASILTASISKKTDNINELLDNLLSENKHNNINGSKQ